MKPDQPRGTVERVFANREGALVGVILWKSGSGPASAVGDFREGQAVTVRNGEVVGR